MSTIQIIILLFILFALFRLYTRRQKKEILTREFIEWLLFWILVAVVTLVPDITSYLASILGVGRGTDLAVYGALLIIFYLMFKIFVRLEKNERQLTQVVRELAIRNAVKKPLDDKKDESIKL